MLGRGRPATRVGRRRRRRRARAQRRLGRRRPARGRGRRERRHVPRPRGLGGHRHQRRARPPRALGRRGRAAGRLRAASWPRSTGPAVLCADDPGAAALVGRRRAGPSPTARRPAATTASTRSRTERTGVRFTLHHGGRRGRRSSVPGRPGRAQRPQRRGGAGAGPPSSASTSPAAAAALGALPRRRPALRGAGRGGRGRARRQLRPPAHRGRGRAGRRPGRALAPGRVLLPAPPLQPHRGARAHLRRLPSPTPTCSLVTGIYAAGEAPRPGVTGKLVVDAVLDAHPWKHVAWLPDARRRRRLPRRRPPRRATSASPSAPATSPRVPDRVLARRSRRGPDERPRRDRRRGRARSATRVAARRAPRAPSPPTGSAAPAALLVARRRRRRRSARSPTPWPPPASTCWSWARAATCSWPTPGSPGWPCVLGDAFAGVDGRRAPGARPGRGRACPVVARRTVAAGLTGFEWAVGVPGSIGGAVRMNAGGHGSDMAAVARRGPRRRPAHRGGWMGGRRRPPPRLPHLVGGPAPGRAVRPSSPWRPATSSRGTAELAEIVRLAAGQPARRAQRRLGVHQPAGRLGRSPHRRRRRQGPARSARPRCRPSTPTSSRPTTAGGPTTCCALMARGAGAGARPRGRRAAPRDPAGRLRPRPSTRDRGLSVSSPRRRARPRPRPAPIDPRIRARRIEVQRGVGPPPAPAPRRRRARAGGGGRVRRRPALAAARRRRRSQVAGAEHTPPDARARAGRASHAGDQLMDVDLRAAGRAGGRRCPWVDEVPPAPWPRRHASRSRSPSARPVALVGRGRRRRARRRGGPGPRPRQRRARRWRPALVRFAGPGAAVAPGDAPARRGRARPWRWRPRLAATAGARDGARRWATRSPAGSSPASRCASATPTQVDAKVRSLRTVLEQVDLTCAAVIDVRSPGSPVLTREEACS